MNKFDLKGRAVLVLGGAKGIGYAAAERMLDSGAEGSLWDLDAAGMADAARAAVLFALYCGVVTSSEASDCRGFVRVGPYPRDSQGLVATTEMGNT